MNKRKYTIIFFSILIVAIAVFPAAADLEVDPESLDFGSYDTTLTATLTYSGFGFDVVWARNTLLGWLDTDPRSGRFEGWGGTQDVEVTVDRSERTPGRTYTQTIIFYTAGSPTYYAYLDVSMRVPYPPRLSVSPGSHDFEETEISYQFTVQNTGEGTLDWGATISDSWISLSTYGGSLGPGAFQYVTVMVNRAGLSPGPPYTGTISFTSNGGNQNVSVSMTVPDNEPPEISNLTVNPTIAKIGTNLTITFTVSEALQGNPTVTVAENGATFNSKVDNDYTYIYTVQGTEGEGDKTVNVSATDLAGNPGSANTTVTFDFTGPEISNLTVNPTTAKAGTNLTITFTVSEALQGNPTVTVAGNGATFNSKVGNDYTYIYTVQGTEGEGNKPVNVSVIDVAGNPGSANTTVIFDFTEPICSADKSGIWHAEDITITLSASDDISGIAIARYNWDTPASGTAGIDYSDGETITLNTETDGKTLYLYVKDNAGRERTWNGTYYLDKTDPGCSADKSGIWHAEDITITLSASDDISGIAIARYNWDTPASATAGIDYSDGETITLNTETDGKTLYLYVKDNAGREKTWNGTYYLDKTGPICSADKSGIWHVVDIIITLSYSTEVGDITIAKYNWDTEASETIGIDYSDGETITLNTETDGKTLYLYVKDSLEREKTWSGTYYLDKTDPDCSADNSGEWYREDITITLSASDDISGIEIAKYNWDTEASETIGIDYSDGETITLNTETDGKTLYLYVKDNAGREKTWNGTYYLDKTPPSNCSISINKDAGYTNSTSVKLILSASDAISDVTQMKFSTDTVHYSEPKTYATSYDAFTLPEGDGEKTVYVKFKDKADNWSDPVSDTITLDTEKPTVELKVNEEESTILYDEEIVGVLPHAWMEAQFSKVMDTGSVKEGLELIAMKDNLNKIINEEVSLSFKWEGSTKTVITPVSELKKNHLYELKVTTTVTDLAGNSIEGEEKIIFRTIMDHEKKNVVTKERNVVTKPTNEKLVVTLEAYALTEDGYLIINTEPLSYQFDVDPEDINVANEKSIANGWYPVEGCLWEIKARKENGEWIEDEFDHEVKITFPYEEDKGVVKNAPLPLKEETLLAFWLDEEHSNWVRVPGSRVDKSTNVVITGEVPHFSVYALMGSAVYDLNDAHAYPVPWKPNDGKDETGTEEDGITFADLSAEGVIKIYTISGELVKRYDYKPGDEGEWIWDVETSNGERVFSGVYIYYIKNEKEHKTGRLIVIR